MYVPTRTAALGRAAIAANHYAARPPCPRSEPSRNFEGCRLERRLSAAGRYFDQSTVDLIWAGRLSNRRISLIWINAAARVQASLVADVFWSAHGTTLAISWRVLRAEAI